MPRPGRRGGCLYAARGRKVTPVLREAALYQYVFFAAQVEGETGELRAPDPGWLQATLAAAARHPYDWLGCPLPAGQPAIALPPADTRRRVVRLHPPPAERTAWSCHGRRAAYAEIYLHNGVLSVRLAYGCRGDADDETYRRLAEAAWSPAEDDRTRDFLRGQTLCYVGRAAGPDAAQAIAARLLPAGAQAWPLRRADLPLTGGSTGSPAGHCAAWLFDRPGLPDRLALLYPDDDEAERQVAPYLNAALPELLLALHKIAHLYGRGYEAGLRPLLAERERALAAVLAGESAPAGGVNALDARLTELAEAYHAFARELAIFDRVTQAVRVNLLNLREHVAEYGLPREGPPAAWLTAAERAAGQMEADEGFYRARVRQAEMALAALQVQAEVERAHLEQQEDRRDRQRNLLLGFIAAMLALGQVIGDETIAELLRGAGLTPAGPIPAALIFIARLALVLGVGLLVVGALWALGRLRGRREQPRVRQER
ncbi:MAG: hypothetical protein RMN52_06530 [Anaerolineae bacterium]|nr:hypothetical protein [Candidatus Roseilinea sp.]MDW8449642.1 hypothetical protein [Anaerolineae bacterium]